MRAARCSTSRSTRPEGFSTARTQTATGSIGSRSEPAPATFSPGSSHSPSGTSRLAARPDLRAQATPARADLPGTSKLDQVGILGLFERVFFQNPLGFVGHFVQVPIGVLQAGPEGD